MKKKLKELFFEYLWAIGIGMYLIGVVGTPINTNWRILSFGLIIILIALAGKYFIAE